MAVTAEDVLIRFIGDDKLTPHLRNINSQMGNMGATGLNQTRNLTSATKEYGGVLDDISGKLGVIGNVMASAFGVYGLDQIYQQTVGVAALKEGYEMMLRRQVGGQEQAKKLLDYTRDWATKTPIMFRDFAYGLTMLSTKQKMNIEQMKEFLPIITDLGVAYQLRGRNAKEAMGAIAMALMGNFRMLRMEMGITAEQLKEAGWKGSKEDVEGFTKAMTKVLDTMGIKGIGTVSTFNVKLEEFKGQFRAAASQFGDILLPYLTKTLVTLTSGLKAIPKPVKIAIVGLTALLFAMIAIVPWLPMIAGGFTWLGAQIGLTSAATATSTGALTTLSGALAINTAMLWANSMAAAGVNVNHAAMTPINLAAASSQTVMAGSTGVLAGALGSLWVVLAPILPLLLAIAAVVGIVGYAFYTTSKEEGWFLSASQKSNRELTTMKKNVDNLTNRKKVLEKETKELEAQLNSGRLTTEQASKAKQTLIDKNKELTRVTDDLTTAQNNYTAATDTQKKIDEQQGKVHQGMVDSRYQVEKEIYDTMLREGKISKAEYDKKVGGLDKVTEAQKNQKEGLTHLQRINDRYRGTMHKIMNDNTQYGKAFKNNEDRLNDYKDAWEWYQQSMYDAETEGSWWIRALATLASGIAYAQIAWNEFEAWFVAGCNSIHKEFMDWIVPVIEGINDAIDLAREYLGLAPWEGGKNTKIPDVPKATGENALLTGANPVKQNVADQWQKFDNRNQFEKLTTTYNSPLTVYREGGGPPLLRFPQITPEFEEGVKKLNSKDIQHSKVEYHTHHHTTTIDARHMSAEELMSLMVQVFKKVKKPTGIPTGA